MLLEVENLKKFFYSKKMIKAVDGISFTINKGEIFGLLGPNGAGKTTTIKMICGLIIPTEGKIMLNRFAFESNHRYFLENIGAVLEGARNVYWRLSIWENIMLFASRNKVKSRDARERASILLKLLQLDDRKNSLVGQLSRGMQQKVALACALIKNPSLLLLDEPTLGLDIMSAEIIKSIMKKLKEDGTSILLTTHDMQLAEQMSDRVAIIDCGKIIIDNSVASLKDSFSTQKYRFIVEGDNKEKLFQEINIQPNKDNILYVDIKDNDDLYNIIEKMRSNSIKILDIRKEEIELKEIFKKLIITNQKDKK